MKETKVKKHMTERGVTLIALVISIVILVILAAVLINISIDNIGIVDSSLSASKTYAVQQYEGTIEEAVAKKALEEAIMRRRSDAKWPQRRNRKHRR